MSVAHFLLSISISAIAVSAGIFQIAIFDTQPFLNGQVVNAAGAAFYLGLSSPGSYCPAHSRCPAGNTTVFAGMGALWVEVPGGQEIYVASSGELSYTPPHSSNLPPDVAEGQFKNVTVVSDCDDPFTIFNWESATAPKTGGILACPKMLQGSTTPTYQIYVRTPAFSLDNCTEVLGLLPHLPESHEFGAFQYA